MTSVQDTCSGPILLFKKNYFIVEIIHKYLKSLLSLGFGMQFSGTVHLPIAV